MGFDEETIHGINQIIWIIKCECHKKVSKISILQYFLQQQNKVISTKQPGLVQRQPKKPMSVEKVLYPPATFRRR